MAKKAKKRAKKTSQEKIEGRRRNGRPRQANRSTAKKRREAVTSSVWRAAAAAATPGLISMKSWTSVSIEIGTRRQVGPPLSGDRPSVGQ